MIVGGSKQVIKVYAKNKQKYGGGIIAGVEVTTSYTPQELNSYDFEETGGFYDNSSEIKKRLILQDEDPSNDQLFNENEREFEMPLEALSQKIEERPLNSDLKALESKWYRRFLHALE